MIPFFTEVDVIAMDSTITVLLDGKKVFVVGTPDPNVYNFLPFFKNGRLIQ